MAKTRVVQSFKLDQRGLARVFGELEARIMDAVWRLNEPTVQDVCDHLGGDYNYKTVMTVMNRLVQKRVLRRRLLNRAYLYSPSEGREDFLKRVSLDVAEGLLRDFGDLAIAQFVNAVDAIDPARLAELERLVHEKTEAAAG
jgi:predicted transcriptional regulator